MSETINITAARGLKAFLRRHPEIKGLSACDQLIRVLHGKIKEFTARPIPDTEETRARLRCYLGAALNQLVVERQVYHADIYFDHWPVVTLRVQPIRVPEYVTLKFLLHPLPELGN